MGTRHLTCVVLDGEFKIAQYGQWDGYLMGQGKTIFNFIEQHLNTDKFKKALSECKFIGAEEVEKLWEEVGQEPGKDTVSFNVSDKFKELYPALHRDTGANILFLVQDKGIRKLHNEVDFAADSLFCEFAYVLDMDNEILEIYTGFNTNPVPAKQRFSKMKGSGKKFTGHDGKEEYEYYPVLLFDKIKFKDVNHELLEKLDKELSEADDLAEQGQSK